MFGIFAGISVIAVLFYFLVLPHIGKNDYHLPNEGVQGIRDACPYN